MLTTERFVLHPMQEYTNTQAGSPVRICCSRQCTQTQCGVNFVQVRMQNLSEQYIFNVVLTLEAFDENGEKLYEQRNVVLSNCCAEAGARFGEERMIALMGQIAASLKFTVECVVFDDGLLWRKNTRYRRKKPELLDDSEAETVVSECESVEEDAQPCTCEDVPIEAPTTSEEEPEAAELPVEEEPTQQEDVQEDAAPMPEDVCEAEEETDEVLGAEESVDRIFASFFETERLSDESNRPDPAEMASEIFRRIFEQDETAVDASKTEEVTNESTPEQPESAVPPETSSAEGAPNVSPAESAPKKRSYALLIWILILLGLGLVAYALYLLYINGNIPWIS